MIRHRTKLAALGGAVVLGIALISASSALASQSAAHRADVTRFQMVRSAGVVAASCLPHAHARVAVQHGGPVEVMTVNVSGLPPKREFDLFVIQVPNAPFGVSWYQGDIDTDSHGVGHGRFLGRFSIETFVISPGSAPVARPHPADATSNPPSRPCTPIISGSGSTRRTRPRGRVVRTP